MAGELRCHMPWSTAKNKKQTPHHQKKKKPKQWKSIGQPWGQDPGTLGIGVYSLLFFPRWKGPQRLRGGWQSLQGGCMMERILPRESLGPVPGPVSQGSGKGAPTLARDPGSSPRMMPSCPSSPSLISKWYPPFKARLECGPCLEAPVSCPRTASSSKTLQHALLPFLSFYVQWRQGCHIEICGGLDLRAQRELAADRK